MLTLKTTLLPHQEAAVEKISRLRVGALFMDMGTGKSRTAMELVARRQGRIRRVVWFCPVAGKETIKYQIELHTEGEAVHVFNDRTTQRSVPEAFWHIVGIESMSTSRRVLLTVNALIDAHTLVIVDESDYIKGHRASRTTWITRVAERARYRLILTGTPVSQGAQDLFAQMRFLSPDILGYRSFYSFAHNHLEYSDKYKGMVVRTLNTAYLAARIAPYVYQVTKEECLSLPDKLYETRSVRMTPSQQVLYERAKDDILQAIDEDDYSSYTIFRLFTALQQITCGFWHRYAKPGAEPELLTCSHQRLDVLESVLGEIPPGAPVLIWAKYRRAVEEIAARLQEVFGEEPALYYGDLSEKRRGAQEARFHAGGTRFFVATPSCGGQVLTLNEAAYAVFYTNDFKYRTRQQAEDRCHRIGQTQKVTYIDLMCLGSIDERIQKALAKKGDAVAMFRRQVEAVRKARGEKTALKQLIKEL